MTDSTQEVFDEVVQDKPESILWSPTCLDRQSSQSQSVTSADFWRTQRHPIPLKLQQAQERFPAALAPYADELSSPPGSSGHSDRGAIVSDLKKALPTLLRENSIFRERMYAQSEIEPDASPTADRIHEVIIQEQCRPRRSESSHLLPDAPCNTMEERPVLLVKTPPGSPPFNLSHFSSHSTLTAEHAPLHPENQSNNGIWNLKVLESLRKKEISADPLFTLPLRTQPPLPDTPSANEVAFLLRTQARRRRKQIHSERIGESVFPGQERRAVRRRLDHVALGKDYDVWPPSAAHPPALAYSEIDEEHVAILIVSPVKGCPEAKGSMTDQIPIAEDTTTRVLSFLSAQSAIEPGDTQTRPYPDSAPKVETIFDMTGPGDTVSVSSGRSLYLNPNTLIDVNSASSTTFQPNPVSQHHKARAAPIDLIEQFPAPLSVAPQEEPVKRVSPPKAEMAGFEEHSKRRRKRQARPESLTHHATVPSLTTAVLRTPLSPCSRNIGVRAGEGRPSLDDSASPRLVAVADTSNSHAAAASPRFLHDPSAFENKDQENLRRVTVFSGSIGAQSPPAQSTLLPFSRIQSSEHSAGQTTQDTKSSSAGQVLIPTLLRTSPLGSHASSPKRKHRHRRGPAQFPEEGLGKAVVYISERNNDGASGEQKSPSSGSMDSVKAKEYLRLLNEHIDNLCQERDQAVRKVSVLEEEVMRLKTTVVMLKREVGHWEA